MSGIGQIIFGYQLPINMCLGLDRLFLVIQLPINMCLGLDRLFLVISYQLICVWDWIDYFWLSVTN